MELRVGIKRAIFTNTARTKIGDLFFAVMPVPCTRTFKYTNTSLKSADLIRVGEKGDTFKPDTRKYSFLFV